MKEAAYKLWNKLPSGECVHCGSFVLAAHDNGRLTKINFRYTNEYLAHPAAHDLDPIHAPLKESVFEYGTDGLTLPGFLDDMLPDKWGRALIARHYSALEKRKIDPNDNIEILNHLPESGIGALRAIPHDPNNPISTAPVYGMGLPIERLSLLDTGANKGHEYVDEDELQILGLQLLVQGSNVGGARPKALVYDDQHTYLAKFNRQQDTFNQVLVEHTCLEIARDAQIRTTDSITGQIGAKPYLLAKRFDTSPDGGRYHMLTMNALLKDQEQQSDNRNATYNQLARILISYSCDPEADLKQLFGQMLLNEVLNNRDDHLRNFSLMHTTKGWRLTPAYDIVPELELNKYPQIGFGYNTFLPSLDQAQKAASAFNLTKNEAQAIADQIGLKMNDWITRLNYNGVPEQDASKLSRVIK
ncbi:type II toxin-antitoxin system HipA family toxin [Neptuniibacter sp. QD37_11]|uniref:type II toxin-antitoxin system HipA family toxin n=1 Tax=Neptuniibacter sp. QD37_11 TaxID=3398209 RepID=UPI0039F4900C